MKYETRIDEGLNRPLLIDENEAAALLGIEARTLRRWRIKRGIPHVRLGYNCMRYRRADLEQWLQTYSTDSR